MEVDKPSISNRILLNAICVICIALSLIETAKAKGAWTHPDWKKVIRQTPPRQLGFRKISVVPLYFLDPLLQKKWFYK